MQNIDPKILQLAPPKQITVTITEEDRRKADFFCNTGCCILATALTRMGYGGHEELNVSIDHLYIDKKHYRLGGKWDVQESEVYMIHDEDGKEIIRAQDEDGCFYAPTVVGKTVVLTRANH